MKYKKFIRTFLCSKKFPDIKNKTNVDPRILVQERIIKEKRRFHLLNKLFGCVSFGVHKNTKTPLRKLKSVLNNLKESYGITVGKRLFDSYSNFHDVSKKLVLNSDNDVISLKSKYGESFYLGKLYLNTGTRNWKKIIHTGKQEYKLCKREIQKLERKNVCPLLKSFKNLKEARMFVKQVVCEIYKKFKKYFPFPNKLQLPEIIVHGSLNKNESKAYFLYNTPTCKFIHRKEKGIVIFHLKSLNNIDISDLSVIIAHEVLPGHFFQHYYFPSDFFLASNVFIEGWGLYVEKYMDSFGDSYKLARLRNRMLRSVRCIIDPMIHMKHIGYQRAFEVYRKYLPFLTKEEIQNDIRRYYSNPGQACSYLIGCKKIERIVPYGDKHDKHDHHEIKQFHKKLLRGGAGIFFIHN
jgi:uncharacterized protein (DUF885 family)